MSLNSSDVVFMCPVRTLTEGLPYSAPVSSLTGDTHIWQQEPPDESPPFPTNSVRSRHIRRAKGVILKYKADRKMF